MMNQKEIEAVGQAQYDKWRAEKDKTNYLKAQNKVAGVIEDNGGLFNYVKNVVTGEPMGMEKELIESKQREKNYIAAQEKYDQLSPENKQLVDWLPQDKLDKWFKKPFAILPSMYKDGTYKKTERNK